jgi:phospholipid/cholesterol/gamma-HCH transport system substrate-binding protein
VKALGLEARVGLLVLVALVLLGGFLFVLGGFSFGDRYVLNADFDNPGAVKPGAPVTIAGIKVGTVDSIELTPGRVDPETRRRSLVRMKLAIEPEYGDMIREDCLVFVTSQSVLGEQIVAIDPGNPDKPALPDGSAVRGVDPPRLDLALALGYELLDAIVVALRENREDLTGIIGNLAGILRSLNHVLSEHEDELGDIVVHAEQAFEDATALTSAIRERVEAGEVTRIVRNLDRSLAVLASDLDPLLDDAQGAASSLRATLDTIGPEEREDLRLTIHRAAELAEDAQATLADARAIASHVREGRGTIGALAMDEELYDDLSELLRDLKHNPWKFFWRD